MRFSLLAPVVAFVIAAPAFAASPSAKFAAPQLLKKQAVALSTLYPTADLSKNRSAGAVVKLTVASNGKVLACELIEQIGDPTLAVKICGLVKRIKPTPARAQDGAAMLGVTTTLLRLFVPGTPQGNLVGNARRGPDATVEVRDVGQPTDVEVVFQVGTDGKSAHCAVDAVDQAALTSEVCAIVAKATFDVISGEDGMQTSYVTHRTIRLTPAQ